MLQDIFIIGATGKVGSTLVSQIYSKEDTDLNVHENPTCVVGLASSQGYIYNPDGLNSEVAGKFSRHESFGTPYSDLFELVNVVKEKVCFIDVTPVNTLDFHRQVISKTPHSIVTANKIPLASSAYHVFQEITKNIDRYGFRCSVMAGAEAVTFMQDTRDLRDSIISIEGCLSGTLGYIPNAISQGDGKRFSKSVKEAHKEGYTESHPAQDLSGNDVARKLLILARAGGVRVDMEDVEVTPLVPQAYLELKSPSEFLDRLDELDTYFEDKISKAQREGLVLRYVASLTFDGGRPLLKVGPKLVPQNSPLGMLQGTANKIVIRTETYDNPPYISPEVPGAGLDVTARNIRRDLLARQESRIAAF